MNGLTNIPGFYGKMPALGDFVSRRLSMHFVQTWDHWLQNVLSDSKAQLGPDWLDIYLTSPIWRFVLSPGISGAQPWAGILMPSVDKVGRYFPLTLAMPIVPVHRLPGLFQGAVDWFEALEHLALMTLQDELDADALDQKLQAQPFPGYTALSTVDDHDEYANREGQFAFRASIDKVEEAADAFARMGARLLTDAHATYSLWHACEADRLRSWVRAYRHLPTGDAYAELLMCREGGNDPEAAGPEDTAAGKPEVVAAYRRDDTDAPILGTAVPHGRIQWRSVGITNVGKHRRINEDAYLVRPEIGLWVVADGMGGHSAGDKASRAVIDTLAGLRATGHLESFIACTTECLQAVNADLLDTAATLGSGGIMGATVVVLLAVGHNCAAIWAGDSRLYRLRGGKLAQLTRDHSLVAELAREGILSASDSAGEKMDNVVTRALGADADVKLDTITFEAGAGDLFLLCSDGLVKEVRDPEIEVILNEGDFQDAAQRLINVALERGARDNVTAVTVSAAPTMVESSPVTGDTMYEHH